MKSQLTFLEATSLVVGAGVGGGVMAVPYLASQTGLLSFLPVILIAAAINIILNLLLVDVLVRDDRDLQIVELMTTYVFRGRFGKQISWVFFTILGFSFIASLTAYIAGAGEVVAGLWGIPILWSRLLVYVISALIVFFGLKSVGISEKVSLYLLVIFSLIIIFGSIRNWNLPVDSFSINIGSGNGRGKEVLALFGIVMYSLNAAFAVPQAVKGLDRNLEKSSRAVITGTLINAALIVLVTITAVAVSNPVTEVAVIGIGASTNKMVAISGSLFVIVAMLTTYWSVSLALADMISQRFKIGYRGAWLAATTPTVILILFGLWGFVEYLQIAGGLVALVVVYVTVPMYKRSLREHPMTGNREFFKKLGSPVILWLFILGMILMAVGSLLGM
jgi:amino acid permease